MPARVLPPGPPGTLLGGNLREFRRDMLAFYLRLGREYGDLVPFRLGTHRLFLVNHPDLIQEVLVTRARQFRKHYAFRMNRLLLGNGLLTSEGEYWLRQRRLAQPAFHRDRIQAYGGLMVAHTERLLKEWEAGTIRDIHADMTQLTLEIIARALFDADVRSEARDAGAALAEAQECFIARFQSLLPLPEWVPTPTNLRLRRAVHRLDSIVLEFIRRRQEQHADKNDLLSLLLHARDEDGGQMTDRQLRDEMMTLFLAGHDTTALTLSWAWYVLAEHPEIDARLSGEIRHVLQGRAPTVEDLPRLPYTEQVVKETLRLYPAAYTFGREALEDLELRGCQIRRGESVLLAQWVTHRDPRFWDAPERFDPDRWTTERVANMPRFAYFPFGGGPRVCIGKEFSMLESILLLATIAQRFRLERADPLPVRPAPSLTLRPERGILMRLHARD